MTQSGPRRTGPRCPPAEASKISKGWTRRPSFVSRDAYDKAYEEIFGGKKPKKRKKAKRPDLTQTQMRVVKGPDGCQIANVMSPAFGDQRSRA